MKSLLLCLFATALVSQTRADSAEEMAQQITTEVVNNIQAAAGVHELGMEQVKSIINTALGNCQDLVVKANALVGPDELFSLVSTQVESRLAQLNLSIPGLSQGAILSDITSYGKSLLGGSCGVGGLLSNVKGILPI